jgi:putative ABC transport system permease protein
LTLADAEAIKEEVSVVKNVAPDISGRYQITSKGKNTNTSVSGVSPVYTTVRNITIDQGIFISEQHLRSLSKVAVIGPTTSADLFGEDVDPLGKNIRINNIEFKVIGVTKSKGGSGFSNQDDIVFIPITVAGRYLTGENYVSTISVQAIDSESMALVQQEISALLLDRHNIKGATLADFSIMNQADIIATASSVTGTFTILLSAIAGISLLVGGIGIMNMMLTTVTERTKEIGLRKAIGAKRRDINLQFLTEAVMLTLIGGILGVILGFTISFIVTYFGILQTKISLSSTLLAFGISTIIGIIFRTDFLEEVSNSSIR